MQVVQGTKVRLAATFMLSDGTLADPTRVQLYMRLAPFTYIYTYGELIYDVLEDGESPTTAVTPPDIVNDGVGIYYMDVVLDTPGEWSYYWTGEGDVVAIGKQEIPLKVEALPF